jgi:starch phosphorylase
MHTDKQKIKAYLLGELRRHFNVDFSEASLNQIFMAVMITVKNLLSERRGNFNETVKDRQGKRVYYLCMEFLVGKTLQNNLYNLGLTDIFRDILAEEDFSLQEILDYEPDAGLGNGGLGRLAACFMDSLSTLSYPATGFPSAMNTGFSSKKSWTAGRRSCPTCGSRGAKRGSFPAPTTPLPCVSTDG